MKFKKTVFVVSTALLSLCFAFSFAACANETSAENCEHEYSVLSDADQHWQECDKCGHTTEKEPHYDSNSDRKCDFCGAPTSASHAHAWSWRSDATQHWQTCSCGGEQNRGAHTSPNSAGQCATCGYQLVPIGGGGGGGDTSGDISIIFTTGWEDPIKDVHIHLWAAGGDYTEYLMDENSLDVGGDAVMTDLGDGSFEYVLTPDDRGDVIGIVITFAQDGDHVWQRAKSTDILYDFAAGGTYTVTFSDWNNTIYGEINWDTWAIVPFDATVS